jgi:hypothetical protein
MHRLLKFRVGVHSDSGSHKYLKKLHLNWRPIRGNSKPVLNFIEEESDCEVIAILLDIIECLIMQIKYERR